MVTESIAVFQRASAGAGGNGRATGTLPQLRARTHSVQSVVLAQDLFADFAIVSRSREPASHLCVSSFFSTFGGPASTTATAGPASVGVALLSGQPVSNHGPVSRSAGAPRKSQPKEKYLMGAESMGTRRFWV